MTVVQPQAVAEGAPRREYGSGRDAEALLESELVNPDCVPARRHLEPEEVAALGARDADIIRQVSGQRFDRSRLLGRERAPQSRQVTLVASFAEIERDGVLGGRAR